MEAAAISSDLRSETAAPTRQRHQALGVAAVLVVISAISFLPALWCEFINLDDFAYVTSNQHVKLGLSVDNVEWAFANPVLNLYHPLTTLSFMADYGLFGTNPVGYHVENVLIHCLNVVLLFTLLRSATGSLWRSATAAAIFGVHPLRVESVLWVAERKDVLSLLFGLLAMAAFLWHCRKPGLWRAGASAPLFALSLLAKPMLVTLPFVLLLMDYWPLERMKFAQPAVHTGAFPQRPLWYLLAEKTLLFAMVLATIQQTLPPVSIIRDGDPSAVAGSPGLDTAQLPASAFDYSLFNAFHWRLQNAPVSYVRYLYKMVDFSHLSAFYPAVPWSPWQVAGSLALLGAITAYTVWNGRRKPWLAVGWLWYLGSLVPVIGIVLVSAYSLADRYTYFPMIGILIAVIWSIPQRWAATSAGRTRLGIAAGLVVALFCVSSFVHAGYWRNSATVWDHALAVTQNNWLAHDLLGAALHDSDPARALQELQSAEGLEPYEDHPFFIRGRVLSQLKRTDEAIEEFRQAVRCNPKNALAAEDLALLLNKKERYGEALFFSRQAVSVDPNYVLAYVTEAAALTGLGRLREAVQACQKGITLNPQSADAHHQMGLVLLKAGRVSDAVTYLEAALGFNPRDTVIQKDLSNAKARLVGPQPEPTGSSL